VAGRAPAGRVALLASRFSQPAAIAAMAYPFVDFNTNAANLKKDIDAAKAKNAYAGKEASWDQTVLKAVALQVNAALKITDDYAKKVAEHHQACKKALDEMEAPIKKKGKALTDADRKVIATSGRFIVTAEEQIRTINADMFSALSEFRAGWPDTYRALLSKPAQIEPFKAARLKSIDDGKKVDTLKKRLAEYVARAGELLKLAAQAGAAGSTLAGQTAAAAAALVKEVKALKDEFDTYAQKASNSLQQIADLPPKQKVDPKLVGMNQSRMVNGQAEAKNARGQQKTLETRIEVFKKLAAKLDGAEKKAATTALDAARVMAKAVAKAEKDLATLEAKAVKTWAAVSKLK
jgi:hypothetical protein